MASSLPSSTSVSPPDSPPLQQPHRSEQPPPPPPQQQQQPPPMAVPLPSSSTDLDTSSRHHTYSRKQKSLGLLCSNFLSLYDRNDVRLIGLDMRWLLNATFTSSNSLTRFSFHTFLTTTLSIFVFSCYLNLSTVI
nr:pectinesterase inhibitor 10-like [Quercus suber]